MPHHLVTSALPLAGALDDLDGIAGALLPADAYCRFLRARGEEVLFVCAGDPAAGPAPEPGPAAWLGLSFDAFGRASSPQVEQLTQYFVRRLEQEGYVVGAGGSLLLLQSRLVREVRAWAGSRCGLSPPARSVLRRWHERGVGDWCITGPAGPGVPVGRTGFEGVSYRGRFAAPIAYIGATRAWAEARGEPGAWRRWWHAEEDVRHVQFTPRAGIPAHAMGFPCTLIGARESWKLADEIKAFERLSYYGGRFPGGLFAALAAAGPPPPPADCWRYSLLSGAAEAAAESFSWEGMAAAVNADLVAGCGEVARRCLDSAQRRFDGAVPSGGAPGAAEVELSARLDGAIAALGARLEALDFRGALAEWRRAWRLAEAYLERELPAEVPGRDDAAALRARVGLNLLALLARLGAPLLPFASARLLDALGVPAESRGWPLRFEPEALAGGHPFVPPPPLFDRIEGSAVDSWRERFAAPAAAAPAVQT